MASLSEDLKSLHTIPLTAPVEETASTGLPEEPTVTEVELRRHAEILARDWRPIPATTGMTQFLDYIRHLRLWLDRSMRGWSAGVVGRELTPRLELVESGRILEAAIPTTDEAEELFRGLPQVHLDSTGDWPRIVQLARAYIGAVDGVWSQGSLETYVQQIQTGTPLFLKEVLRLSPALRIAQAELLLDKADEVFASGELPPIESSPFSAPIHSLRRLNQAEWGDILESLIPFDVILRQDPAKTFSAMDDSTRMEYRLRIAKLARHSTCDEMHVAESALELAREAVGETYRDPRVAQRKIHIGYYLLAEGTELLKQRIAYNPSFIERIRHFVRTRNVEFYILGTFTLSLLLITAILLPLVPHHDFWAVMAALLLAMLPATQGAVDLINGI